MIIRPRPLFCQYLPDVVKKNIILAWVQSIIFVLQCLLRRSAKVLYWIKATNTSLYPLSMLWRVLLLTIVDRFFVMWWWWHFNLQYNDYFLMFYWAMDNISLLYRQLLWTGHCEWGVVAYQILLHVATVSDTLHFNELNKIRYIYGILYILHKYIEPSATFEIWANYTSCFTWFSFCCIHFHHWLSMLLHWTCEWHCRGNTPCNQPRQVSHIHFGIDSMHFAFLRCWTDI